MKTRVCLDRQFVLEELPRLTTAEIRVLMCLHLHHSVERGCWPSVKVIAGLTGLHRGTVHAALASLEDKGLIDVDRVNGKRRYWLPVDDKNVLLGGSEKDKAVSPTDDCRQGEVSSTDDQVSPLDDRVSPLDDSVSPRDDSESGRETTDSRMPHAGARAHTPKEVTIEETQEVAPPAAAGVCIHAPGEPEPEPGVTDGFASPEVEEGIRTGGRRNSFGKRR